MNHRHFKIHKPYGYLSQFINNQDKRRNKKLLGELGEFPEGIMAIGRLDENSEGLLLLTTDGKTSEYIRSSKIEKEYYVQLDGEITEDALVQLRSGVVIKHNKDDFVTKPCSVKRIETPTELGPPPRHRDPSHGPTSWISITITEGKFRQVRKMTAKVDFPTIRLVRVRIGKILLVDMKAREVQELEVL